jgi:hypothetical protein
MSARHDLLPSPVGVISHSAVSADSIASLLGPESRSSEPSARRTSVRAVTFVQMEHALRRRLEALPPAARAELIHVLRLPDFDRVDRIGEFWSYPESRAFAELLIDCEEDRTLRAVLVGMLRE